MDQRRWKSPGKKAMRMKETARTVVRREMVVEDPDCEGDSGEDSGSMVVVVDGGIYWNFILELG